MFLIVLSYLHPWKSECIVYPSNLVYYALVLRVRISVYVFILAIECVGLPSPDVLVQVVRCLDVLVIYYE
jgi:hypothetical protein